MQDRTDAGKFRCRTDQMQDRMDAGHDGCGTGWMRDRTDAGLDGCRIGRMQDRTDAGNVRCRTDQMQDRTAAGQVRCSHQSLQSQKTFNLEYSETRVYMLCTFGHTEKGNPETYIQNLLTGNFHDKKLLQIFFVFEIMLLYI